MDGFRWEVTVPAAVVYPLLYFLDTDGWFAALLPGAAVHELGHALAIKLTGGAVLGMRLDLLGLRMDRLSARSGTAEALCAAAGPALGLVWAIAAGSIPGEWWAKSARAAWMINLFNLLPALPLDGGRLLLALTDRPELCIAGLICSCTALCAAGALLRKGWLLLVAAFLAIGAIREGSPAGLQWPSAPGGRSAPGRPS